jgi:drug/metabolite transporter (DMT)-like permease
VADPDPDPASAAAPRLVPALVVAVAAISFAALFFKQAQPTHPLVSAGVRLLAASLLLAPWTVRGLRRGSLRGRQLGLASLAGLAYAVHFGAWVASLALTSVAASVTVVTASPLLLAFIGLATGRDRPSRRLWLALGVAVVGLAVVGSRDAAAGADSLTGDGLALLGALAMAVYLLLGRRLGSALDLWAYTGVATAVGALSLVLAAVALGVPLAPASGEALGYLLLAALVPQLVGHSLLTWSLRHAAPAVVGTATLGEPVGATLLAWLWLGEAADPWVVVGCAVTLVAVAAALAQVRSPAA